MNATNTWERTSYRAQKITYSYLKKRVYEFTPIDSNLFDKIGWLKDFNFFESPRKVYISNLEYQDQACQEWQEWLITSPVLYISVPQHMTSYHIVMDIKDEDEDPEYMSHYVPSNCRFQRDEHVIELLDYLQHDHLLRDLLEREGI